MVNLTVKLKCMTNSTEKTIKQKFDRHNSKTKEWPT